MTTNSIPFDPEAIFKQATALHQAGKLQEAAGLYQQLLARYPKAPQVLTQLGTLALQLGKPEIAIQLLGQSLEAAPNQPTTLVNRGIGLGMLGRFDEALRNFDHAIALDPQSAEAYNNRGYALNELKRYAEALTDFDRALALKPDHAEACNNRGNALNGLKRHDEALASYDQAIAIKPGHAGAYNNKGDTFKKLNLFTNALENYKIATAINPDLDFLNGIAQHTRMCLCIWDRYDSRVSIITNKINNNNKTAEPFPILALSDLLTIQRKSSDIYAKNKYRPSHTLPDIQKHQKHSKLRIGYFSADFHNHATMHLMAELFERHDKNNFELIAFSFGPDIQDEWRSRAVDAFDRFIDVRFQSDKEVALLARRMEIDIAVDLKGFTQDARTGIFAERAAPIQVNYLGYPGTMGADYIDYLIADRTLIPEHVQTHYSENIVYLPHCYQVNDMKRTNINKTFTRSDLGLPESGIVFCCFNNNYKIVPGIFDAWMRILTRIEGSVLWLLVGNTTARDNLRTEAKKRGVDVDRLIFAEYMPIEAHLARIRLADLFLDTFPYNAHTTASDALRVGLPLLTYAGESFASRVAASLLNTVGLPELVTTSLGAYEALAIELAQDNDKLKAIKEKLTNNLPDSPLYNAERFARHIEAGFIAMYERYQNDLEPDHIYLSP